MVCSEIAKPRSVQIDAVRLAPILACSVWSLCYFWMVQKNWRVGSTHLKLTLAKAALFPEPWRQLMIVVTVVFACALEFWLMFTQVNPILHVRVGLF